MAEGELERLAAEIRACRICAETPLRSALPHAPNPILRVSATARLCIASQAAGTRAHASSTPFDDASGDRLRAWLGLDRDEFYDVGRIAIVPMGFCFPGQDAKGGDLPPRRECAPAWRARLFRLMPQIELVLAIGQYAQAWHLGDRRAGTLTETVARWREHLGAPGPAVLPLPHPSWRNNGWLRSHPWFETELLPVLRSEVRRLTS
ncbi:uracil-DNA glycosylase family protein [Propylenella binzhouense]|uniref:Uracil-DNA glycosylase family protein n=1 Tax=Propylenella binzhouense TaxID=2555902 RepID=A0A964T2F5_9HYPH|nr:uracil-DNA glycosylase family protein [Propylenella binzhouense]MYZ47173.1 uracil-DNA glycosylase family protein [Propylenella binzhouense]